MVRNFASILIALRKFRRNVKHFDVWKVWVFAVVIGVAAAYGVIAFRFTIDVVSMIAFGEAEGMVASGARSIGFVRAWAAPIIGGIAVSAILYLAARFKWLEDGRGQGVAEVIEARAVGDARISLRAGLAAATVSFLSLGAGASAGREGPAVHLGAMIASMLDRHMGFSAKQRRIFPERRSTFIMESTIKPMSIRPMQQFGAAHSTTPRLKRSSLKLRTVTATYSTTPHRSGTTTFTGDQ